MTMHYPPPPNYVPAPLTRKERGPWAQVALSAAVVGGIFGVAAIVGHVAETVKETRRLFRPNGRKD